MSREVLHTQAHLANISVPNGHAYEKSCKSSQSHTEEKYPKSLCLCRWTSVILTAANHRRPHSDGPRAILLTLRAVRDNNLTTNGSRWSLKTSTDRPTQRVNTGRGVDVCVNEKLTKQSTCRLCAAAVSLLLGPSADGVEEIDASQAERLAQSCLSIVPRSRSHARVRRNATMSHAF
ncbi:hypothetical protein EVAR_48049_1 [Eumeta japonica]|uniref:Uncharacterized protein n=1 Tax=Eumeta variegata TaxID=151549 RepID=A0A4C1XJN7_EUMVA|nr:hypothetical protein EVAR_48049_1 [Eumeta japonica]